MKLVELFEDYVHTDDIDDFIMCESAKPVWARSGNKVVRKYRCTSGKKQGRLVSDPSVCGGSTDLKKRMILKKLLVQKKAMIARKSKKTKKHNPVSIRIQKLNKMAGR